MGYLGIDLRTSFLLRRDSDSAPTVDLAWTLGTPTQRWLNIHSNEFTGALAGNAATSSNWFAPITITATGDATGSVSFDGSSDQTLVLTVGDDTHNHTTSTIISFTEDVQDVVGGMIDGNTEAGLVVTYDDTTGKINFDLVDTLLTLDGDVSGNATITNNGDTTLTVTVLDDSHTHDGRYYTEVEADSRFINNTGDSMTGSLAMGGNEVTGLALTPSVASAAASKSYVDTAITTLSGGGSETVSDKVSKAGDTMTGNLTMSGGAKVTGLPTPSISSDAISLGFADGRYVNLTGDVMSGNLTINGDLTVSGTTTTVNTETVNLADNIITLNSNETGAPTQDGGIEIERGTELNYRFMFREADDLFVIGEIGSEQPVATRPENPDNNGIAHWDSATNSYITDANLTWDGSILTTGKAVLSPQDGVNEGGELELSGAGSNPAIIVDNYAGALRIFQNATTDFSVSITNPGSGAANFTVGDNATVNGVLTVVGDPTIGDQVGNRDYNDSRYVNTAGDTLTGSISMGGFNIQSVGDPISDDQAMSRGYADSRYVNVSGDTVSGPMIHESSIEVRSGNYLQIRPTDNLWDWRHYAINDDYHIYSGDDLVNPVMVMKSDKTVEIANTLVVPNGGATPSIKSVDGTSFLYLDTGSDDIWMKSANYTYIDGNGFAIRDATATETKLLIDTAVTINVPSHFNKATRGAFSTVASSATLTLDMNEANHFDNILTAATTLANPTNQVAGQSGVIVLEQDGAGGHTLAFGTDWKFAGGTAPTINTTANSRNILAYTVIAPNFIFAYLHNDVK